MTVLVITDETDVSESIQDLLEFAGHACLVADDVAKAEWLLQTVRIDAWMLDLGLPGRNPLGWLEEQQRHDPELARRSVVLTDHRLPPQALRRLEATGARILERRCGAGQLRDAIIQRGMPIENRLAGSPPPDTAEGGGI